VSGLVCILVGVVAVLISATAFHLWVRLWHRIFWGRWGLPKALDDVAFDAFDVHLVVFFGTAVAVVATGLLYLLGCAEVLGVLNAAH
jgi:hypothetical protein